MIENILTPEECENIQNRAHQWLENVPKNNTDKVLRDDKKSWKNITKVLYAKHGGLIQHFGVGQSQFVWDVRQHPKVIDVFRKIWKDDNLITSFDAANITPPPEDTNLGWQNPDKHWLHTDQSPKKQGMQSIQGLVNLEDVSDGDATLCVVTSSNKLHSEFFTKMKKESKGDWYKLENDNELKWFLDKGCQVVAISAPKGSMILWDSRTIHMGLSPQKMRKNIRWRYVVYVAMFPRKSISTTNLKKRAEHIKNGRMTNHWGVKLFPKVPHTYGGAIPEIDEYIPPNLTDLGKSLI